LEDIITPISSQGKYLLKTFPPEGEGLYPAAWKLKHHIVFDPLKYKMLVNKEMGHNQTISILNPDGHPKSPTHGHFKIPHLDSFKM